MLNLQPSPLQKRQWESLAWLELQSAFAWLADQVPGLARVQVPMDRVHAVSSMTTGQHPVVLGWSKVEVGVCDSISIPYSLLRQGVARRQVCWLTAGFLHAGYRYGLKGPKCWRKISKAGGIAGVLFPGLAKALSLHRLEGQAMLILAAGSRLAWARLRVPMIRHVGLKIRKRDIDEAGWLGDRQDSARMQAQLQPLHGDEWILLVLDSMVMECHTLACVLDGSKEKKEAEAFFRLENDLQTLMAVVEGRGNAHGLKTPTGALEQMIQSMVLHRKINNTELTTLLTEVEKLQLSHLHRQ